MGHKNILIYSSSFHQKFGGAERQAALTARKMAGLGIKATILTIGPPSSFAEPDGIHVDAIPVCGTGPTATLARMHWMYQWLRQKKNEIGITQFQSVDRFGLLVACLMRWQNIPFSIRISGIYEREQGPLTSRNLLYCVLPEGGLLDRILLKGVLMCSKVILALNDEIYCLFIDQHTLTNKVVRITNGVDTTVYHPARLPREMPLFTAVFVGRLDPVKGLRFLLSAWCRVKETAPDAHLLIIGEGPERERLERRVHELKLEGSVKFLGYRKDIPALLRESDLFILTSSCEGMPNALLEGMASGLPVVCTDIPATRQCFNDGEAGYFVPFGDVQALSERILELYWDPGKRKAMGSVARSIVEKIFSVDAVTRRLLEIYGMISTS